jgi:hypothetical protein
VPPEGFGLAVYRRRSLRLSAEYLRKISGKYLTKVWRLAKIEEKKARFMAVFCTLFGPEFDFHRLPISNLGAEAVPAVSQANR